MSDSVPGRDKDDRALDASGVNGRPAHVETIVAGGASTSIRHESAAMHVSGSAAYIDDLPEPKGLVHVVPGLSTKAHARIVAMDLDAVRAAPGVVRVLTGADVPGHNQISPVGKNDEPLLATDVVSYWGQPLFAVVADTREAGRRAARLANVTYDELPAILDIAQARAAGGELVWRPLVMKRGDVDAGLAASPRRLAGQITMGGQEHFYLEGQAALAQPGEEGEMRVWSSTQHPTETQHMIAHVLGVPSHLVTTEVRRMGGGFGGKETQANAPACLAALAAVVTGRAAKMRLDRDDDMMMTGKRHDFVVDYDVGFDDDGRILAVDMVLAARCGWSADLSGPVLHRALLHADNACFYSHVRLRSEALKTNTQSNTAFRGFGTPQAILAVERMIDEVAFATKQDPLTVRHKNVYGPSPRDLTPYYMSIDQPLSSQLMSQLADTCDYARRRDEIRMFNGSSPIIKRGIALTPVKFGISFTSIFYNQAGALVHIYADGSVLLNHGGTEMGQGLHTKMVQIVMREFGLTNDRVRITPTTTGKVPNTSPTAGSTGADLNGMAVLDAVRKIKTRLVAFAAGHWAVPEETILFTPDGVRVGAQTVAFSELTKLAYYARVSLSSNGFFKTPKIWWDDNAAKGRPFLYFAYGAACSEVVLDSLTGESRIERVDIIHDAGQSLNPAIDIGQIEGGFLQGAGWLTMEELVWDHSGKLSTHSASTYKIPTCSNRPRVFNVCLAKSTPSEDTAIFRSKAVSEAPLIHSISVFCAITDALASINGYTTFPRLDAPATPETILRALSAIGSGA